MYSNDVTQIRSGLTQYIGALTATMASQGKTARNAKHEVAAILGEEMISLSEDENGEVDVFVLKPLLRATLNTLSMRMNDLSELSVQTEAVAEKHKEYAEASRIIHSLVESIK